MPLSGGTTGAHDDSSHQGSAKRDVADGLAGLGAGGQLLAPGPDIELTRDGSENIEVAERTSGDIVYRWTRIGANDYECRINCGGVACIMQNDSMKDIASGIAGLNASVKIPAALLDIDVANGIAGLDALAEVPLSLIKAALTGKETDQNAVVYAGSYGGNNTVNRAIPHSLGRASLDVQLWRSDGAKIYTLMYSGNILHRTHSGSGILSVTPSDSTNFYVGNSADYTSSANATGETYYWVAKG